MPEDTIIVTNSSTMVSSKFAEDVKSLSRLYHMHYYNPAFVMEFFEAGSIINRRAENGWSFVGCIPTVRRGVGITEEIDLIFEKEA